MRIRIIDREIVREIAQGINTLALMEKYRLSRNQLRDIFRHLSAVREKRIDSMVSDLDYGMTPPEFMRKYGLTSGGLVKALNILVAERVGRDIKISKMRGDLKGVNGTSESWPKKQESVLVRLFPRNSDKLRRKP